MYVDPDTNTTHFPVFEGSSVQGVKQFCTDDGISVSDCRLVPGRPEQKRIRPMRLIPDGTILVGTGSGSRYESSCSRRALYVSYAECDDGVVEAPSVERLPLPSGSLSVGKDPDPADVAACLLTSFLNDMNLTSFSTQYVARRRLSEGDTITSYLFRKLPFRQCPVPYDQDVGQGVMVEGNITLHLSSSSARRLSETESESDFLSVILALFGIRVPSFSELYTASPLPAPVFPSPPPSLPPFLPPPPSVPPPVSPPPSSPPPSSPSPSPPSPPFGPPPPSPSDSFLDDLNNTETDRILLYVIIALVGLAGLVGSLILLLRFINPENAASLASIITAVGSVVSPMSGRKPETSSSPAPAPEAAKPPKPVSSQANGQVGKDVAPPSKPPPQTRPSQPQAPVKKKNPQEGGAPSQTASVPKSTPPPPEKSVPSALQRARQAAKALTDMA